MLDEMVARTRAEVEARKKKISVDSFKLDAETRSLKSAILHADRAVITEIKPASPSEGKLRDVDVVATARAMERGGACAISVLTEPFYFSGSLENLKKAKEAVRIPVMRKDFIVDEYQLFEAKYYGADAVLLIVSVLGKETKRFYDKAKELGMEALVEVHEEGEIKTALDSGAGIIGINNRDLKTLKVDLDTTKRLADKIPKDRITVSESGIKTRKDLDLVLGYARAALIGTSVMRADDVEKAVQELVR